MKEPMATKTPAKPAAKAETAAKASTAVAVRKTGAVVNIKDALAAQVAALNDKTQPSTGNQIRLDGKKFILPDGQESDEPLKLVIVDFVSRHRFYPGKYDPKNITPPACFAIGENPRDMTPSANSPDKQADSCQGCPMNEFGSDGDGKACKNERLLAVLPPDADEDTPIWLLSVSPTALKGFDGYVKAVAREFQVPPVGVITTVSLDENTTYARLMFGDPELNEAVAVHYARQAEAKEMLMTEPDVSQYQAPAKAAKPAQKRANARR